ncbi:hypothetical protein AV926_09445 [Myroides marinus]|uniref:PRTase ComF-like n=1 Tax=Myroides marinus TaxID=703342 RepID=A0A163Z4K4_9FLAO|nr:phosphoribosyltransferase family protein [Myroides marinus]KZE80987.1 hypothetical protein AV926_09445 [Myroides marinus]
MVDRYSLHKIDNEVTFTFSPSDYSVFKFGNTNVAEQFAKELFQGFIEEYADSILGEDIYIFPSPYMSIPTASNYLCYYFKVELDRFLFLRGFGSSKLGKIHRKQTYTIDYGNLSFEDRKNLIANDTYYIDKELLKDKLCIFLDDIKITGSHEYTVKKILNEYKVEGTFLFLYYAEVVNANLDPRIENFFNYYTINSAESLVNLINSDSFRFNTRVIKYILNLDYNQFNYVVNHIREDRKAKMFDLAISNDYHLLEEYQINLKKLYYGN